MLLNEETGSFDNPLAFDACMEASVYTQQKVGG